MSEFLDRHRRLMHLDCPCCKCAYPSNQVEVSLGYKKLRADLKIEERSAKLKFDVCDLCAAEMLAEKRKAFLVVLATFVVFLVVIPLFLALVSRDVGAVFAILRSSFVGLVILAGLCSVIGYVFVRPIKTVKRAEPVKRAIAEGYFVKWVSV